MDASVASLSNAEEIKPYKIHVSSKYLDLTRKKLELTRLPHELLLPNSSAWSSGTPKSEIEPLIDFWLEHYDWRTQESHLNNSLPQFRTAFQIPLPNPNPESIPSTPLRIHFLHIKSPYAHAIPLLLIPSFPLTNLSLIPLFAPLTDPQSPTSTQPFHLVVPSLPGLGFSDAWSSSAAGGDGNGGGNGHLASTATLFNTLMGRLGYNFYISSSTGDGRSSPAGIDYHLARLVAENYPDSCLGVHLLSPIVSAPTFRGEGWEWAKYRLARFFHAEVWGYVAEDFTALTLSEKSMRAKPRTGEGEARPLLPRSRGGYGAVTTLGLREPNTFAYALCDSPVGLLSLVCSALRRASPKHRLSNTEIIDFTQLAWLPGPEAGMRFWAGAVGEVEVLARREKKERRKRARVGITVFGVDGTEEGEAYTPPAWSAAKHDVVFAQRVSGRAGLVSWERTDVVVAGIRGLAREVERRDGRLRVRGLEGVIVEPIVEVDEESSLVSEERDGHGMQLDVESPDTIVAVEIS